MWFLTGEIPVMLEGQNSSCHCLAPDQRHYAFHWHLYLQYDDLVGASKEGGCPQIFTDGNLQA